jgi:AcrR family transcriptional regulator
MKARPYNSRIRKDAEAATLRRIVAATVELHAEKGAMETTHADIAARAGVSVPTVYKHFPTRNAVIPACMGYVAKDAPVIDMEEIMALPDLDARLERFVPALHAQYRYYAPWYRWADSDARWLPALAEGLKAGQAGLEQQLKAVLSCRFRRDVPVDILGLVQVILGYGAWQTLSTRQKSAGKVSAAAIRAVRCIVVDYLSKE